jgi:5-methylcytosine-specific restriction endonuclease McrA
MSYGNYLRSAAWHEAAAAAVARAGGCCQVCGADRWLVRLDVHHNTYERLGRERPADLVVLCRGCHRLFHRHGKLAARRG